MLLISVFEAEGEQRFSVNMVGDDEQLTDVTDRYEVRQLLRRG